MLKQGYHAAEGLGLFSYDGGNTTRYCLLGYTPDCRGDRSCERISVNCDTTGKPIIGRETITPLVHTTVHCVVAYWFVLLVSRRNSTFRTSAQIFHVIMTCYLQK